MGMFRQNSPLRRLPPNSNRKLLLSLDSLRHSAEICDIAYFMLDQQLTSLANYQERTLDPRIVPVAFMHAWAIVDELHRVRGLLAVMKDNLKYAAGEGPTFDEQMSGICLIRDIADHLPGRLDQVARSGAAALGQLDWVSAPNRPGDLCIAGALVPGTVTGMLKWPAKGLAPRPAIGQTDYITLTCGGERASLTDAMISLSQLISALEDALDRCFAEDAGKVPGPEPGVGYDVLLRTLVNQGHQIERIELVRVPPSSTC